MSLAIEVKLKGGLGNQLFQYATGRSLAITRNAPFLILNPDSYLNDVAKRNFGLGNFRIKATVLKRGLSMYVLRKGTKVQRCFSALPFYGYIEERGLVIQRFPERLSAFTCLSGYWQSDYYFRNIRETLLEELLPLEHPKFPCWVDNSNTVAVHVRRTDYLTSQNFGALDARYYSDAMALLSQKLQNPLFVFFSDDIEWCKQQFKGADLVFCQEKHWERDYLQLFLMSRCKHQIIANSSFSWWAAWLNIHPSKLIVRPERPFLDESLQYESYYPLDWITLKN